MKNVSFVVWCLCVAVICGVTGYWLGTVNTLHLVDSGSYTDNAVTTIRRTRAYAKILDAELDAAKRRAIVAESQSEKDRQTAIEATAVVEGATHVMKQHEDLMFQLAATADRQNELLEKILAVIEGPHGAPPPSEEDTPIVADVSDNL